MKNPTYKKYFYTSPKTLKDFDYLKPKYIELVIDTTNGYREYTIIAL